ncbi:MAG: hypothetical protein AAGC47_10640 [Bacteroidota bacterium]
MRGKRFLAELEKKRYQIRLELLTFGLVAASFILLISFYENLPERVQIYFNWPSKDEVGLAPRNTLWYSAVISLVVVSALTFLNRAIVIKDYSDTRQQSLRRVSNSLLRIIALLVGAIFLLMTVASLFKSNGFEIGSLEIVIEYFPLVFVFVTIVFIVRVFSVSKS